VFDDVTKRQRAGRAARRARYVLGACVAQIVAAALLAAWGVFSPSVDERPPLPVVIVRPPKVAAHAAPSVAPPAPARRASTPAPKPEAPRPAPPPPAVVQPRQVAPEPPAPEPPPAAVAATPGADVAGEGPATDGAHSDEPGVAGGGAGATAGAPVGDGPVHPTSGYRRAQLERRSCIAESIRVPPDLRRLVNGVVMVKFAVGADGAVSLFEVVGDAPDPRIASAIWQAIQACRFLAGADPQGRPTKLWVLMPIRFADG
jgi:protein TonB